MAKLDWNDRRNNKARAPVRASAPLITSVVTDATGYGNTALHNEVANVLAAAVGRRNHTLNVAAFNLSQLVATGVLDHQTVWDALERAAVAVGLELGETRGTLRSGFSGGTQYPRQVAELPALTPHVMEVSADSLFHPPGVNGHQVNGADPGHHGTVDDAVQVELEPAEERTSWWPLPVTEAAEATATGLDPTHLTRDDGQSLLYPGKVNGLIGESESGKSWVQQFAITQALDAGQRVLLLDFEDSATGIHERMTLLGVPDPQLQLLEYANPTEALGIAQADDLAEALGHAYGLIALDGVNAAMTLLGYDLNSNTDATLFNAKLLRPLASTGATVLTVDHVPKSVEQRGKGGIGAQAKRSMQDGCCLRVEVKEPFGRGQSGKLTLRVDKDRPGKVRGASSGASYAGTVDILSTDHDVRMRVRAPDLTPFQDRAGWRPTHVMTLVSDALELLPDGPSMNEVVTAVKARREVIAEAVRHLILEGFVRVDTGANRKHLHHLVKPYREVDDPQSDRFASVVPTVPGGSPVVPGTTDVSGSQDSHPRRGGNHWNHSTGQAGITPVVPGSDDGFSNCNTCGESTTDVVIDSTGGYCRRCAGREQR